MLVVTLGDPFSINVEACYRILQENDRTLARTPIRIVGSKTQWHLQLTRLGLPLIDHKFEDFCFIDVDPLLSQCVTHGATDTISMLGERLPSGLRGTIAKLSLNQLRALLVPETASRRRVAVITGPIDKAACAEAGFPFPGQTEFFADMCQCPTIMLLANQEIKVGLVTNHLALRQVSETLNQALIRQKLVLFAQTLAATFGIERPRIAVCGVNPHASEGGLFGDEEKVHIAPALKTVRAESSALIVEGPVSAEHAFFLARRGRVDGVLAMYHDQGLAPIKLFDFHRTVNITGGLPFLRVSPDHGPVADLFLAGCESGADWGSWRSSFRLAIRHLRLTA